MPGRNIPSWISTGLATNIAYRTTKLTNIPVTTKSRTRITFHAITRPPSRRSTARYDTIKNGSAGNGKFAGTWVSGVPNICQRLFRTVWSKWKVDVVGDVYSR